MDFWQMAFLLSLLIQKQKIRNDRIPPVVTNLSISFFAGCIQRNVKIDRLAGQGFYPPWSESLSVGGDFHEFVVLFAKFKNFFESGVEQRLSYGTVYQQPGRSKKRAITLQGFIINHLLHILAFFFLHPIPQTINTRWFDVAFSIKVYPKVHGVWGEFSLAFSHFPVIQKSILMEEKKILMSQIIVIEF